MSDKLIINGATVGDFGSVINGTGNSNIILNGVTIDYDVGPSPIGSVDYIANEVFLAYTDFITGSDYISNQVFS